MSCGKNLKSFWKGKHREMCPWITLHILHFFERRVLCSPTMLHYPFMLSVIPSKMNAGKPTLKNASFSIGLYNGNLQCCTMVIDIINLPVIFVQWTTTFIALFYYFIYVLSMFRRHLHVSSIYVSTLFPSTIVGYDGQLIVSVSLYVCVPLHDHW